ncbi:MAG: phospholipase D-like domain-containing protein [Candidatus Omnitrophica bacterium]|nr:phospholipase D-like domain-containing protein [Candidatus Omnitrophota bacterium]MCM8809308.1 phospholipase D-like domain-containing protein [Candidatus Omnitrophota bacterium]MCM8811166.1 phospholipase D-like domain-containing protein [Candidatus Omnitrophota bacterium]MCM8832497.1 phospholipase D-like domain-containing protein [Candidatus Omnitrophota bacterium]
MKKIFFSILFVNLLYSEIKVFFTPSKKSYIEFKNLLKKAEKSIYIASYSVNHDFLKFLDNKKIDIKIICEYGDVKFGKIKKIEDKNLFHTKFLIIDEKSVLITSANLTFSNFCKNHNNFILINDKNLAKYLLKKFDSFWNDYTYTETYIDKKVEIWFSPENDCEKLIEREIGNAKKSINFATFTFTNKEIAEKIIEKQKNNIEIQGIIESYNIFPHSVFYLLLSYNCKVRKSCTAGFLHDKFFIIDREKVITGSFNPTKSAKENVELVCLIKDRKIAEIFYREWWKLYLFKSIKENN